MKLLLVIQKDLPKEIKSLFPNELPKGNDDTMNEYNC